MSLQRIAERVGVNLKTADKYVRESSVPKRTKAQTAALISARTIGRPPTRFGKPVPDVVCDLYREGATLRDLEARFSIDRKRLSEYMQARGVPISKGRTTPARLQAARKGSEAAKRSPRNDEQSARTRKDRKSVV